MVIQKTESRLTVPGLTDAILGGLAYISDSQVFNPEMYKIHSESFRGNDFKSKGLSGKIFTRIRSFLGRHIVPEQHIKGAWPGFIQYMPENFSSPAKSLFIVTDYNLFTTVSTAYPLFLFNDSNLPEGMQFINSMLLNVNKVVGGFKRGKAYNFWPTKKTRVGFSTVGPVNIPLGLISLRWYLNKLTGLFGLGKFRDSDSLFEWVARCYNRDQNSHGSSAMVNIPDDADNTSNSIVFQILLNKRFNSIKPDTDALDVIVSYRDVDRKKDQRWNKILHDETGGFLTWLKDERQPGFENPGEGIIPWHINNVDVIVNANVIFALKLAGRNSELGFNEAENLIIWCIETQIWDKVSVYYPERLMFPYYVSRAWRDARIDNPLFEKSLIKLLDLLLKEQKSFESSHPELAGVFPCNVDSGYVFSTVLFLLTLLNLGEQIAEAAGRTEDYRNVMDNAVYFLLENKKYSKPLNKKHSAFPDKVKPIFWKSGILYSSSMQNLAVWKSEAQTTSLVLEALAKYLLGYDRGSNAYGTDQIILVWRNNEMVLRTGNFVKDVH